MPPKPKLPRWLERQLERARRQSELNASTRPESALVPAGERSAQRAAIGTTARPDVLRTRRPTPPTARRTADVRQLADVLQNPAAAAVEGFGKNPPSIRQIVRIMTADVGPNALHELALWTGPGSALQAVKEVGAGNFGEAAIYAAGALPIIGQLGRVESRLAGAIERAAATLPELEVGSELLRLEHRTPHELIDNIVLPGHTNRGPVRGAESARQAAFPDLFAPRSYHTVLGGQVEAGFERLPAHIGEVPAGRVYDWAADPLGVIPLAQQVAGEHGIYGPGVASIAEQILKGRGYAGYRAGPTVAMFEPVPIRAGANRDVLDVARRYRESSGIAGQALPPVSAVDREAGEVMARSYERLRSTPNDPAVRDAYRQFVDETRAQYRALQDAGYTFEFVDKDPYPNSAAMLRDLRENKHLRVFRSGEGGHPILTPEENDIFRAVHDAIGHGQYGYQFGPKGEENAFRAHAELYSPAARRVMATETRGQNSWVNFGPHAGKPPAERPFAEQKAALWPEGLAGDYPAIHQYEQIPTFERRGGRAVERPGFFPESPSTVSGANLAPPRPPATPEVGTSLDVPTFLRRALPPETMDASGKYAINQADVNVARQDPIVAAAYRGPNGKFYTGLNHGEAADALKAAGFSESEARRRGLDGFMTRSGQFITRKELQSEWGGQRRPVAELLLRPSEAAPLVNHPPAFQPITPQSLQSPRDLRAVGAPPVRTYGFPERPEPGRAVFHGTYKPGFDVPTKANYGVGPHVGTSGQANEILRGSPWARPGSFPGAEYPSPGSRVIPLIDFTSNPVKLAGDANWGNIGGMARDLGAQGALTADEVAEVRKITRIEGPVSKRATDYVRNTLMGKGYDSLIYPNRVEASGWSARGKRVLSPSRVILNPERDLYNALDPAAQLRGFLLQEEAGLLTGEGKRQLGEFGARLDPAAVLASGMAAGRAARGGYSNASRMLAEMFGPEAPRFTALLSALSPRQPLGANLYSALEVWDAWKNLPLPDQRNPRKLTVLLNRLGRANPGGGELPARVPNAVRALTATDPTTFSRMLSGPKVEPFRRALMGDLSQVVLDTWGAQVMNVSPKALGGVQRRVGGETMKVPGAGYLAPTARVREAAHSLGMTPAEGQEAFWSWARSLDRLPRGELRPSHELVRSQWDLPGLLREEPFASQIGKMGLPTPSPAQFPPLLPVEPDPEHLRMLRENIERSRRGLYLFGLGGLGLGGLGAMSGNVNSR